MVRVVGNPSETLVNRIIVNGVKTAARFSSSCDESWTVKETNG